MSRVLVSREYPPAPGGGIGTYATQVVRAHLAAGDTVHVLTQAWPGAPGAAERLLDGRLVVHRLPVEWPGWLFGTRAHPALPPMARAAWDAGGAAACFAVQVAERLEQLVATEPIAVIEAPEYEAPLWHHLRHRTGGPPCLIHLHSPSALIALANGEGAELPVTAAIDAREADCIRAADGLICPSRYLAGQVADRFGVPIERIAVIRYPLDDGTAILRSAETWAQGSILYAGRLELRKGVLEWLEAAVALADRDPSLRFDFVGADHLDFQLGHGGDAAARVPARLRHRFTFHDPRPRHALGELLARARLAIVPSRWENFPYTCIEAMASGLPVVVTPAGGMAEMVRHGATGWIAATPRPADLAAAVREALARRPDELAVIGAQAAHDISRLCDPGTVVRHHRELLARVERDPAPGTPIDPAATPAWRTGAPTHAARLLASLGRGARRPVRTTRRLARQIGLRLAGGRS